MRELRVERLSMSFGRQRVFEDISFSFDRPQICGLIGPNGAGKSTLINCLSGFHRPSSGAILLDGERVEGLAPFEIARRGLSRTFQIPRPFGRMTLLENLQVPARRRGHGAGKAMEALGMLDLSHLAQEQARALSGGQLKLLELARLTMLDPDIVLLDEPFAGVHARLRKRIQAFIAAQCDAGRTVIVVEHDIRAIFAMSERLLVLAEGKLIADGEPEALKRDPRVIEAYLGRDRGDA